jgi:hypothetical protein
MRAFRGALVAIAVAGTTLVVPAALESAAAVDAATIGNSSDNAGGSCWEIKQDRPTATDGVYWLLTPAMSQPQQFYCDMTTSGGGWVLIGKGREGWTTDYEGKGNESDLLTPAATSLTTTTQLSSKLVDGLLNNGRVDALTDGVRLRRAKDTAGATWQDATVKYTKFGAWAWTFAAEYPVGTFTIEGSTGSGGTSANFGLDTSFKRVTNTPQKANMYKQGFAYGSKITGNSSSTSYLYTAQNTGNALPFTDVYIRPHVMSNDAGFTSIGDSGTAGFAFPSVAKSKALASPWGVSGLAGTTSQEGDIEVQAFTQSGNTVYVGGNFKYVQQDANGLNQVNQPFLAAFDVNTGEFIPSFAPVLNEQVHSLATLPNGDVVAGGEFTVVNGQPATYVVALDPTTGATDTSWHVTVQDRLTNDSIRVNTLEVSGGYVYIGGAVTHFAGGSKPNTFVYSRGLARVSVADGTPDSTWKPNFNGSVASVSASPDGTRMYAVGYFGKSQSATAFRAAAVLTSSGAALATPAWTPTWSNANKNYQHTVDAVGNKIWVGGSEHSLFQYDPATFTRTMGDIFKTHGDVQAIADASNGVVYAGCHCSDFDYRNAYTWSTLSSAWTDAHAMDWIGAWSATTGERIKTFTPTFQMREATGIWGIFSDSTGVVWAGGDITTVATPSKTNYYAGGFARFPLNDSTPPTVPTQLAVSSQTATTVTLTWTKSTDAVGGTFYEILRDDRPIAVTAGNVTSITVPLGGNNRFFVRAQDKAGNYSASTPVLAVQ